MKKPDKPIKNTAIDNAFAQIGTVEELAAKEYDKIVTLYKTMKDPNVPLKFDDKTDLIIAKIPDQPKPPREMDTPEGQEKKWSVNVILPDERWASIIIPDKEKGDFESFAGCKIAIVGKLVQKMGQNESAGKVFWNIHKYRGSMLLDLDSDTKDVQI